MSKDDKRPNCRQRDKIRKRLRVIGAPCAICGRPIDYTLNWWIDPKDGKRKRHPLSFEFDHRVPLAQGGEKGWSNAQAAHRICNQKKGSRMPAQGRETASKAAIPIACTTSRTW